jgi:phage-related protein
MAEEPLKRVVWMGSSRDDLRKLPADVQDVFGFALYHAQRGERHGDTKIMKGFGPGVLEIIDDDAAGTYRAVYTVRFSKAVYVLHVFQKKSKKGIKTPKHDVDLIEKRLTAAKLHYQENQNAF